MRDAPHVTCRFLLKSILAIGIILRINETTISEEPLWSQLRYLSRHHVKASRGCPSLSRHEGMLAWPQSNLTWAPGQSLLRRAGDVTSHHTPPPPPPRQLEASAARKITHDGESRSSTARRRGTSNSFTYLQLQRTLVSGWGDSFIRNDHTITSWNSAAE